MLPVCCCRLLVSAHQCHTWHLLNPIRAGALKYPSAAARVSSLHHQTEYMAAGAVITIIATNTTRQGPVGSKFRAVYSPCAGPPELSWRLFDPRNNKANTWQIHAIQLPSFLTSNTFDSPKAVHMQRQPHHCTVGSMPSTAETGRRGCAGAAGVSYWGSCVAYRAPSGTGNETQAHGSDTQHACEQAGGKSLPACNDPTCGTRDIAETDSVQHAARRLGENK